MEFLVKGCVFFNDLLVVLKGLEDILDRFGCFGSFLLCFFHLVAPRGASAASVARHQRGKSRKEERQDEEEAFLKFAWLFLLLLAIAAFYCFFFA